MIGKSARSVLRARANIQDVLRMIVLPFEEYHSIDGARLQLCKAGFAYEDPETGRVRTISVCAWSLFRTDILRSIADKYSVAEVAARK
jgi:hypothetical protein